MLLIETEFSIVGDKIGLMVNNLGGTSQLELFIVAREAVQYLSEYCKHSGLYVSVTLIYIWSENSRPKVKQKMAE